MATHRERRHDTGTQYDACAWANFLIFPWRYPPETPDRNCKLHRSRLITDYADCLLLENRGRIANYLFIYVLFSSPVPILEIVKMSLRVGSLDARILRF